ncbi:MAG TPA: Shedu immune nuclease family protein [Caulobacteraceae bacterium]|nr:Shedu immune nuclease family protein [Caulobacteraceae bacterium]
MDDLFPDAAAAAAEFAAKRGKFSFSPRADGGTEVFYQMPEDILARARNRRLPKSKLEPVRLLWFADDGSVVTEPRWTLPERSDYLEPKYDELKTITFEGYGLEEPDHPDGMFDVLLELPAGCVKSPEFGLGLKKDYRFIIDTLEDLDGIKALVISRLRKTAIKGKTYVLGHADFDALRKAINNTHTAAVSAARKDKEILAHNTLLTGLDPERFPARSRPYKSDVIYKAVGGDVPTATLSDRDQTAVVSMLSANKREIAKKRPREFLELQREIELVNFETLIARLSDMMGKKLSEQRWQTFFLDNPFVLSLAFGLPLVAMDQQVSVGGRAFSGKGEKIADFLHKNELTDNLALLEIKTPETALLGSEYRGGVYRPSADLVGSVTQILDQRYHLMTELAVKKMKSHRFDIQGYAIKCVVIAGRAPVDDPAQTRSFELFRNGLTDVMIITFDELLAKLRGLHTFLSTPAAPAAPAQQPD